MPCIWKFALCATIFVSAVVSLQAPRNQVSTMTYWEGIQKLVDTSKVIVARRKGIRHPLYQEFVYPFDYGYLEDIAAGEPHEASCWIGSMGKQVGVTAIIAIVDLEQRDIAINVLIGCSETDARQILDCYQYANIRGLLITRQEELV